MLGKLRKSGYRLVDQAKGADLVLINTCGFIESARQEAIGIIGQMERLKASGHLGRIVVTGCLAERDRESLLKVCPRIDRLIGVFAREQVVEAIDSLFVESENVETPHTEETNTEEMSASQPAASILPKLYFSDQPEGPPPSDLGRRRLTPRHTAYLKIAEGCDRTCSFCTIPSIRGKHASKPIEMIVDEARRLADEGVRELVLIAQDTNYYGWDLYGKPALADLLVELEKVHRIAWIRLMYLYPKHWDDRLIDTIAKSRKILPYLDLPLQHIDNEVLHRMNRTVTAEETFELLERLRSRIEGLTLRTTLLVGFPGETDEQFERLLAFVEEQRFERLGVFPYCRETGTASDQLDGHLDEATKQSRYERLMAAQQEIAFEWNQKQIGRTWDVLIDQALPEEPTAFVGRTAADAPEIDGVVYVTGENLRPGQIVPCEIVATDGYDLVGVPVDAES